MRFAKPLTACLLAGILLLAGGCDSFLERNPQDFTSADEFYSNPDEVEQGVGGIYGEVQQVYDATGSFWAAAEMRSDNTDFQFNATDRGNDVLEAFDRLNISGPGNLVVENLWFGIYQGVSQANTVLNRIEGVRFNDQTRKDQLRGEAQFLRGLLYYHLIQLWGRGEQGVPLVTSEVRTAGGAFSERASTSAVYDQIITDAQNAIENLPPASPNDGDATRATEPAARMLLASARMARGNYEDAVGPLRTVVDDSGHMLLEDYADVFDPDNKGNAEMIFSIGYDPSAGGGSEASSWIYRFAPFNSGTDLVYGLGDGISPSGAGFNIPTPGLIGDFVDGSERATASIGYYENPDNTNFPVAITDSIPYIEKFRHPFSQQERTRENWPVYRFAEAKLLLAEALLQSGGSATDAETQVNDVRQRVDGLSAISGVTLQDVYREQRVELAFENKRWYQLKRRNDNSGNAPSGLQVMQDHAEDQLARLPASVLSGGAYQDVQAFRFALPIPAREVRLNDLQQTQGWTGSGGS
jgi:hypothetical protein